MSLGSKLGIQTGDVSVVRPGGLFLDHAQKKNAEPGARGRILLERAERSRAERSRAGSGDVFEQSAPYQPLRKERRRDGERSDLNGVRIAPPAEVSRPLLAARSRVSESEKDGEWRPSSAAAADSSPPPRTSARKAARGAECIEILSDDEEADGAGPSGAIVIGDDDMPKHSDSTDALVGEAVHPQRMEHQGDFPPHAHGTARRVDVVHRHRRDVVEGSPHAGGHEFLNDSVIEFFIKNLQHKKMPLKAARCHIFNSFFYEKLTNVRDERSEARTSTEKAHQRVEKWTKG